jgi:hypothetical protein
LCRRFPVRDDNLNLPQKAHNLLRRILNWYKRRRALQL